MLATRAFRPAARLSRQVRRYASEASQGGGNNALLYGGAGAGALGLGAWYLNSGKKPESVAPASKEEEKAVPKKATEGSKVFKGGDQGFIGLVLDKVEEINHNTKRFRFKFDSDDEVSGLSIASAIITKYKGEKDEKPTIRPYTPVSDEDQPGYLDFIIKRYPNGPMSEHVHSMQPGDQLQMKGPIPKYPWSANKHDHIALIAGGTGITPMWQLIRAIYKNPEDKTRVTLVYGSVSQDDVILKKEIDQLEKEHPDRFRAFHVLDNPPEGWKQGKGFITKDLLKEIIPGPKEENVKVFVCGPPGLYKAVSGAKKSPAEQGELTGHLKELGYDDSQVYKF
ncbi:NADH-cytochrome b5 reductase [Vermiconidia calcicola]|uniref:NADH-cytochrome b5 reductase n=1 Tax=Vermiconidia calcicola TaxID=1690605 RepID=A0ACC3MMS0_9PEZI|nr:NADH-cytochrome b5 reductase [Vermiconidia calcicola]